MLFALIWVITARASAQVGWQLSISSGVATTLYERGDARISKEALYAPFYTRLGLLVDGWEAGYQFRVNAYNPVFKLENQVSTGGAGQLYERYQYGYYNGLYTRYNIGDPYSAVNVGIDVGIGLWSGGYRDIVFRTEDDQRLPIQVLPSEGGWSGSAGLDLSILLAEMDYATLVLRVGGQLEYQSIFYSFRTYNLNTSSDISYDLNAFDAILRVGFAYRFIND